MEFGRELVATSEGETSFGGAIVGTPDAEMWLRSAHPQRRRGAPPRAGISRDGRNWTWGRDLDVDARTSPKIGLGAHGGEEPAVTAGFSYLRFYRLR